MRCYGNLAFGAREKTTNLLKKKKSFLAKKEKSLQIFRASDQNRQLHNPLNKAVLRSLDIFCYHSDAVLC